MPHATEDSLRRAADVAVADAVRALRRDLCADDWNGSGTRRSSSRSRDWLGDDLDQGAWIRRDPGRAPAAAQGVLMVALLASAPGPIPIA
jgi:hypothetical protein